MRFSLFLSAALVAVLSSAIDLEFTDNTKTTGYDPTKYNWIEKPPNSGNWVKKEAPEAPPVPMSRVQKLIAAKEA